MLTPTTIGVAHRKLPCGTQVTFSYGGRSVTATVIDRGPFHKGYAWDLTKKTAKRVGFLAVGSGPIQATVTPPAPAAADASRRRCLGRVSSRLRSPEDRRIALLRQGRNGGEQALELREGDLGDRVEDLLVAPSRLSRLLDQVVGRTLGGVERLAQAASAAPPPSRPRR